MKKTIALVLVAAGALAVSPAAFAQSTASATATGSATIIQPLTISKDVDLSFGRVVRPGSGSGTVAIANTADTVSAGSGAISLTGITTTRAKFTIAGEGAQVVTVSVPSTFDMALSSDATKKITVTLSPDLGATTTLSGSLGAAGSKTLYVGGNFSLPSTQATGAYSGTFTVNVAYQ